MEDLQRRARLITSGEAAAKFVMQVFHDDWVTEGGKAPMYTCKEKCSSSERLGVVHPVSSQVSGCEQRQALTALRKQMKRVSILTPKSQACAWLVVVSTMQHSR
jgi:hypothetical protein